MDGVGISIIERPRPLPGHDTPNPTEHPYTLKCEEPDMGDDHGNARPIALPRAGTELDEAVADFSGNE